MKPLLFIDALCNVPYDTQTPKTRGLGGTEQTIIRVAEKLSEKIPIVICQHNRENIFESENVTYAPLSDEYFNDSWKNVIHLRIPVIALETRHTFKSARVWLWSHDLYSSYFFRMISLFAEHDIGCIPVSDYHHQELLELGRSDPLLENWPKIRRIYNPIDDDLKPDDTPINYNKLVFTSSSNKGLRNTLRIFQILKEQHPEFELYVTHPGHTSFENPDIAGVHYLESLKFEDSIQHVRSAFCQLALNILQPETFGLVFAEANAVGTPILTHPFGAAPEILIDHEQLVNCHDAEAVIEKILKWRKEGRPKVDVRDEFRLSNVIKDWEDLLEL